MPVLPLEIEPPWPLEALVPEREPSTGAAPAEDEALPLDPSEPELELLPLDMPLFWLVMEPPCPLGAAVSALPPSTAAPLAEEALGETEDEELLPVVLLCVVAVSAL